MSFLPFMFLAILHLHLTAVQGGEPIFEDGYTVTTVLDGDKSDIKVNPHSILPQSPPSDHFILLDSAASTFYSLSLSTTSNETALKRFAGNGVSGYADGNLDSAKFDKPGSFAVDFNGNVYVADSRNRAIRKITKSGVTTIAGGYSQKNGRADGPARDASFSNNFELTFVPQRCALMISDHVLGTTSAWLLGLGLGLSCLLSLVVGFVIHPYIMPYVILLSLSQLSLMFRPLLVESHSRAVRVTPVSILDLDEVGNSGSSNSSDGSIVISPRVTEQLKDLLTFDGGSILSVNSNEAVAQEDEMSSYDHKDIDGMIQDNLVNFENQAPRCCSQVSPDCSLGLVKRR